MTHFKKLQNPHYIGAYSLNPGEERTVTVDRITTEQVTGPDGRKKEECVVAYLVGEKPMILNVTNCKTLAALYGTPYVELWAGKKFTIYAATVNAFGGPVEALRIKNTLPTIPELTPSHPKWSEAIEAMKAGKTTIEKIESRFTLSPENRAALIDAMPITTETAAQ